MSVPLEENFLIFYINRFRAAEQAGQNLTSGHKQLIMSVAADSLRRHQVRVFEAPLVLYPISSANDVLLTNNTFGSNRPKLKTHRSARSLACG